MQDISPGVFGVIETLEGYAVRNLTADGNFTGRWIGGIAQKLDSGTIENCTVTGTMTCYDDHSWLSWETRTGGIVDLMTNGSIKNCTFRGTINTTSGAFGSVGGIVAKVSGGSIENCIVGGADILGADTNSSYAGGIVGYANIANFDAIKDCTFSGTVVVEQYAGGIAGYVSGGNIQNNRITGNANGQAIIASNYASGGIAGRIGDSTILESCDVSSIVTVAGGNKAEAIGGIVGIMNASTLRNNQSYASIEGDIVNMGGVVGKLDAASYTISNNRYSSAEHGIGNNAQGVPSEEGCIKVGASISITTASLSDAVINTAYTATLNANSSSTVVWSLTNGTSLPTGLTLDSSAGTISGTPTKADTYTFTVKASPASGAPATKEFTLKVLAEAPQVTVSITTSSLPNGTVNQSYSATLASSPSGATWSIASGSLPSGLTLNTNGTIFGTPTSQGTSTFTVRATSGSVNATRQLSITINQAQTTTTSVTITTTTLPLGITGQSYSATLASNPSGATWRLTGSLPAGLDLDSSGRISGTPIVAGTFEFTVTANYGSASNVRTLPLKIDPMAITTESLPDGVINNAYDVTIKANVSSGLTWKINSGTLPPGLTLYEESGLLSGTITEAGEYTFSIYVHNANASASKEFTLKVADEESTGKSSGGGGCDSGFAGLGLALLASIFRKSRR
mgnify:CR=1 FL=1